MAGAILTPVYQSCQTLKKSETETVITIDFPEPYDSDGNLIVIYNDADDTVIMPLWYWKKIVTYAVYTSQ